jgi:hypothetical protein
LATRAGTLGRIVSADLLGGFEIDVEFKLRPLFDGKAVAPFKVASAWVRYDVKLAPQKGAVPFLFLSEIFTITVDYWPGARMETSLGEWICHARKKTRKRKVP